MKMNNTSTMVARIRHYDTTMIYVMKKHRPSREQLVQIYPTYIRPLLEYCAPVFHAGLTASQANQLERVQKQALKLIGGFDRSYRQLLADLQLESLGSTTAKRKRLWEGNTVCCFTAAILLRCSAAQIKHTAYT